VVLTCNDDATSNVVTSFITRGVTAGEDYTVFVTPYGTDPGGTLHLTIAYATE
jgi:hypothetical protein